MSNLNLNRRSSAYVALSSFLVGCLVAGLLVPLLFASTATEVSASARSTNRGAQGSGPGGAASSRGDGGATAGAGAGPGAAGVGAGAASGTGAGPGAAGAASGGVTGTGGDAAGTVGGPLTATDVGVTDSTITVGVVLEDVAGAGKFGFGAAAGLDPAQEQAAWESYFNAVNTAGGINGRKIVPTYYTIDVTNADTLRAACLYFTQDKKVFAVLAGPGFAPATRCVTNENNTLMVVGDSNGIPTDWITDSNGLMSTVFAGSTRMSETFVTTLEGMNLLQGKKIGIISDESDSGRLVRDRALIPALDAHGYSPAYVSKFSTDVGTAASQIPVEVQKMRGAGVDMILLVTNVLVGVQFAQAADAQGYKPHYATPDWGAASDAGFENMPSDWNGIWVSAGTSTDYSAGRGDSPAQARCRQIYESATNDKLTRSDSGSALKMDFTLISCDLVDIFTKAAIAAGTNLTRATFSDAIQTLGEFPLSLWGPGGYSSGKFEYSDKVRPNVWKSDCKCFIPMRDF